jgi:MFS family permease
MGGQSASAIGSWMQDAALPWLVLQLTHSPTQVGLLVFCRYAPFLIIGLFSGVLADRFDNRRILICSQAAQLLAASALAVLAFTVQEVWPLFVFGMVSGIGLVLDAPSRQTLTYQLVDRCDVPNAVALGSTMFSLGMFLGPAIAGVLIAAVGPAWCFVVNASSFLVLFVSLLLMRRSELFTIERRETRQGPLGAVVEGLQFAWRSRPTKLLLALVAVLSMTGFNFRALIPILSETTLHSGPQVFGLLFAAFGAGSVAGGLLAASIAQASWRTLLAGTCVFDAALVALAPVQDVVVAAVLVFAIGASFILWIATAQAILQLTSPDHLRGRLMSIFLFAWAGLAPIGALAAGWLSEVAGTEFALVASGLAGLVATTTAAILTRPLGQPLFVTPVEESA